MANIFPKLFSILVLLHFCTGVDNTLCINKNDAICGPQCLLIICNEFNIQTSLKELCRITEYSALTGTSMLGLYQAARKKGLPAIPINIDINKLCNLKNPSIAYVNGNHFLVVHGCKGDKVIIQNPPSEPFLVKKEAFKKKWNGETLVFDKKLKKKMAAQIDEKTAPPEGPHIHFNEKVHSAGTVKEGTKLSHTFRFTNIGSDTLEVSARSTCSCTAALLSDSKIPPGGYGQIKIEYDTSLSLRVIHNS